MRTPEEDRHLKKSIELLRSRELEGQRVTPMPEQEPRAKPQPRGACASCGKPVANSLRSGELEAIDRDRRFCRLRCAASFGVAAYKHGLRMKAST